jgi:hypothetical protein
MRHVRRAASRPVLFLAAFIVLSLGIWWVPRSDVQAKDPEFKMDKKGKDDPVAPTVGLSSWDNSLHSSGDDESFGVYEVKNIDDSSSNSVVITVQSVEDLTNTTTGDTLLTEWQFSSDGDGTADAGVATGGSYGGVPFTDMGHSTGTDNFVSSGAFLNPGIVFSTGDSGKKGLDDKGELTVTSRGLNAEDSGSDDDATEAPDVGDYEANIQLLLTWPE